ncbi:hypothetical protein K2X05_07930 [bacterium]|nr:hypothetical protein [bacterium]
MNKMILSLPFLFLMACSTGPRVGLNCEKLHADSEVRVQELRQVFASYQNINYDLALKLSPPLKEEVSELDSRVRKQKQRCWAKEKRPIDAELALLKDELFKVYGKEEDIESKAKPKRSVASEPKKEDVVESVELDVEE